MIRKRTVLVLGAGAAAPYGFPLGAELLNRCLEGIPGGPGGNPQRIGLWAYLRHEVDAGHALDFSRQLRASRRYSVDIFAGHRPEFIDCAKHCIAFYLLQDEAQSVDRFMAHPHCDGDWSAFSSTASPMNRSAISAQRISLSSRSTTIARSSITCSRA